MDSIAMRTILKMMTIPLVMNRFIKARGVTTSVCHRTYIYQDGKLIYTNKEN